MCVKGGKRCDTHKDGSKATVTLTSKIAEVQEAVVRKIFVILKKEGKGLEAPEKEEVVTYAETGKFLTKYDANMTERQKKSLMRQFDKSKEEEPSGPLFHAWKHTMPEVLRRTRKTMMATGLAAGILFTSACGGTPGGNDIQTTTPPTVPTTISASASPSAETPKGNVPGSVINGIPTKKELGSNSKGKYIQTTISPNDPAFTYNQAIVEQSAFKYTPEEITAVQKQAITFIAEETIGSSLNDSSNAKDREDWWNRNKDKINPDNAAEFHSALISGDTTKPIVFQASFREGKYDLKYGEGISHVTSQSIRPTQVIGGVIQGKEAMKIVTDVNFNLAADIDGVMKDENTTGQVGYTFTKDPASGKWLISGFTNTFNTTPLK